MRFPRGEVDLTSVCRPGETHVLSMLVIAMPLKGVMLSYNDTNSARNVKGSVARRGLCGDVYLASTPPGPRIDEVKIDTSVRTWELTVEAGLQGLAEDGSYVLRAQLTDSGRRIAEFASTAFRKDDLNDGRISFTAHWKPEKLWDIHTRQALETLEGHTSKVFSVAFSPDGGALASGSKDSTVKLWNIAT